MTDTAQNENIPETPEQQPAPAEQNGTPDYAAIIGALQTELAESKDKMLRVLADADNTRKRAERMQMDAGKYAIAGFARDMLDVADNLHRALSILTPEQRAENAALNTLAEGIEATERGMAATLEKHGLRKIAPEGGKFDANVHEVMFEADIAGKDAGEIIQLLEAGYMLHDRLLRPARVGVAKGDPAKPTPHSVDETA